MIRPIAEGQPVPDFTFRLREGARWIERSRADLFDGRTVVVFSLPGAFTPTCSSAHVPRYEELADAFAEVGVDEICCISVNDGFVMEAWKREQGVSRVTFLPDGNGTFTEQMGLLVDKTAIGFGPRSWRYAMVVRDGVIADLFIEPEIPGDPYTVSDADTVLAALGGEAPPDILLVVRDGCAHCARAESMLAEAGLPWTELPSSPRALRALPGANTTPQIFIDGAHIGGADELGAWLAAR